MKTTSLASPVRLEWLLQQNVRLDARPYVGGAFEARDLLKRLRVPVEPLQHLTAGYDGGLYNGPQFRRNFVQDREHGVPFLGSADMLEGDLSRPPLLSRVEAGSAKLAYLRLEAGMTLISCSGTVGRVVYTRPAMDGMWSSQDTIKAVPNSTLVQPGYLFAVLASRFGTPILINSRTGTGIRHLEPHQVADLPVPRFGDAVEGRIHELVEEAARLRTRFQEQLVAATTDLFTSASLPELNDFDWHARPRDLDFSVDRSALTTLRALNYSPRAMSIAGLFASVPYQDLGSICRGGLLDAGSRFTRVPAQEGTGLQLIGQRQGFWIRPEGRWISANTSDTPADARAADETIMVARRGTLGETEVYCRSIFATGSWLKFAYSEDFLRVLPGDPAIPGAYLFALFRSEAMFRLLRSLSSGGKQQDIHDVLREHIPIPLCTPADRARIAATVRSAHRDRDHADRLEDEAFAELDRAVEGATA